MQLRLQPRSSQKINATKLIIKTILFFAIFFLAIFLLDKIEKPFPNKFIKQEISNEELITVK